MKGPRTSLDIERNRLVCQCKDEDLHAIKQAQHRMQRAFIQRAVVR